MIQTEDTDGTYMCVFRVTTSTINDDEFAAVMQNIRRFLRWIRTNQMRYHFVFDMHDITTIPIDRVYAINQYLRQKRDILLDYLESTVIITQSRVVEVILNTAFTYYPPARPMHILLHTPLHGGIHTKKNDHGIPVHLWEGALAFLRKNRSKS